MSTYRLAGKDVNGIRYHSLFETNDLVKYAKDNKLIQNAYSIEIWEMLPEQGTCLIFQMENGNSRHGREFYEQVTGTTVLDLLKPDYSKRAKAVLALPMLTKNTDTVVKRKHKVIKRAA